MDEGRRPQGPVVKGSSRQPASEDPVVFRLNFNTTIGGIQ
jgi:hypothetical protein